MMRVKRGYDKGKWVLEGIRGLSELVEYDKGIGEGHGDKGRWKSTIND